MFLQLLLYLTIVTSSRLSLCDPDQFNNKQSYIKDEELSHIQDQEVLLLSTSIGLKSNAEVNILSNIQPKFGDASSIGENKEKVIESSSIQKDEIDALKSSSTQKDKIDVLKSSSIQKGAVEAFKLSSIQENKEKSIKSSSIHKEAVEAIKSSNIKEYKDVVANSSLIPIKTEDTSNSKLPKQNDGNLITTPSLINTDTEVTNVQKRDIGYNMLQYTPIRIPESEAEAKHSPSVQEKTIQVINSSNMNERLAKTKEIFKCQYGTKTTLDMEARTVCAKGPGEVCGGRDHVYGRCAEGLHCSNCGQCEGCSLLTWVCYYDDHCYY